MINNPVIVKLLFLYFFFSLVVLFTIIVIGIVFFSRRRRQKPKLTNRSTSHSHRAAMAHTCGIPGVTPTEYLPRFSTMTDTARYH